MTARIVYKGKMDKQVDYEFFDLFIKFLQQKYPLKKDITINFLSHRVGNMSTGSRNSQEELNILVKDIEGNPFALTIEAFGL
jgi:hypothetical protein